MGATRGKHLHKTTFVHRIAACTLALAPGLASAMPVATPGALGAADGAVIQVKGGHGHGGGHGWATTAVGWARGRGHHYGGRHHRHWCFNPMGRGASVGGLLHLGQTRMSPIGTFETCRRTLKMSAYRGRPEVLGRRQNGAFDPKPPVRTIEKQTFGVD